MSARLKSLLILTVLMLSLTAAACGGTPEPTAVPTPIPPTKTPVPPTQIPATAVPTAVPTVESTVPLGNETRVEEGGFAYRVPKDYIGQSFGTMVYAGPADADPNLGPLIVMGGGTGASGLVGEGATLEEAYAAATEEFSGEDIQIVKETDTTLGGAPAKVAEIEGQEEGTDMHGLVAVAMPSDGQFFAFIALSTAEVWDDGFEETANAVMNSITFFAAIIPTVDLGPGTTQAPQPTPGGGTGMDRQWASGAAASSQYGDDSWSAAQATGEPNVAECGDDSKAWAALYADTEEWLEVTYDVAMYVTQINIHQTYSPNQVVKVELIDLTSTYYEVYTGEPEAEDCPYILTIDVAQTDYPVGGVRITLDQSALQDWNEIDAVELVGVAAGAVPTPGPAAEPPDGFLWRLSRQPDDLFYAGAGLAIGQDGNIYFVDSLARYHVVSPDGEILNTVQDYDYMFVTSDIDIGPDGNLYIADWGSDDYPIIVYTPEGEYVRSWGSKGTGDGQFGDFSPDYLVICNGEVYVAEENKDANDESYERVQVFDLEGNYLRQWSISEYEDFFSTNGMACGPDGNIYLVGFMSDQILYFSPEGEFLGEVGKDAVSGATPSSLAMDADGYFYVGTWNKGILKIDPEGNEVASWGSNTDEDTERDVGVFKYPDAIVVDDAGNVYVVDWGGEFSYMTKFIFP